MPAWDFYEFWDWPDDMQYCDGRLFLHHRGHYLDLRLQCRVRSNSVGQHGLRLHAVHLEQMDCCDRCRHIVLVQLVQGGLRRLRRDQWVHCLLWRLLDKWGNVLHTVQHWLYDDWVRPLYSCQRLQHVRDRLLFKLGHCVGQHRLQPVHCRLPQD